MALINCKECGKQISDKATKCPGCGYDMTINQDSYDGLAFSGFFLGLVVLPYGIITNDFLFNLSFIPGTVGFILGITGLILSIVGINTTKKNKKKGFGLAITGTVLNSIGLLILLIKIISTLL